ncbi:hypothetical protein Q5752_003394 [Cryptotrichosporon argae]
MSLAISPSDASPLAAPRARPLPPGRSKRYSLTPSPRAPPLGRMDSGPGADPSPFKSPGGVMGGLRERSEDELQRAARDELEDALRCEWRDREEYLSRLEECGEAQRTLEAKVDELGKANAALQGKNDEAFAEQNRLEAEIEARDEVLDKLRKRVAEAERNDRAFDAERQALMAEQAHLSQRVQALSSSRARDTAHSATLALQEELGSLMSSHTILLAQLNTLTAELHEVKAEHARLVDENEAWQRLVEERTLAGTVRSGGGLLGHAGRQDVTSPISYTGSLGRNGELETLDELQEMDELHSEMELHTPILELDDAFDREGLRAEPVSAPTLSVPSLSRSPSPRQPPVASLAAELGMSDDTAGEVAALKQKITKMEEENKSLQLYCSKILDRIISQEGFEHVLSVDYKTRRLGAKGTPTRPGVRQIVETIEAANNTDEGAGAGKKARPVSMVGRANSTPVAAEPPNDDKKKRRGFSIDFRNLGFGGGSMSAPETPAPTLRPLALAARATSVTLPQGTVAPGSPTTEDVPAAAARKLEPQQEDDEDRRERHRMEAALKLMGIDKLASPLEAPAVTLPVPAAPPSAAPPEPAPSAGGWFSRLSRASKSPTPSPPPPPPPAGSVLPPADLRVGSPLSRLTSVLGPAAESPVDALESALSTLGTPGSPEHAAEAAAAALRAYDAREQAHARAIAAGKNEPTYTSPGKIGRRTSLRRNDSSASHGSFASHGSWSSAHGHRKESSGASGLGTGQQAKTSMSQSESSSTLFSAGGSRPVSQDVGKL